MINEKEYIEEGKTWGLVATHAGMGRCIVCKVCQCVSWNRADIEERYCFRCRKYHKQLEQEQLYTPDKI